MTWRDRVNDMKEEELWQKCLIIYKTIDPSQNHGRINLQVT
jgi:hypothetical protein